MLKLYNYKIVRLLWNCSEKISFTLQPSWNYCSKIAKLLAYIFKMACDSVHFGEDEKMWYQTRQKKRRIDRAIRTTMELFPSETHASKKKLFDETWISPSLPLSILNALPASLFRLKYILIKLYNQKHISFPCLPQSKRFRRRSKQAIHCLAHEREILCEHSKGSQKKSTICGTLFTKCDTKHVYFVRASEQRGSSRRGGSADPLSRFS